MPTALRAALLAVALTALASAAAPAATFCVHSPRDCVGTDAATLQAALDAARANGAGRDTIRIGTGLFTDGPAVNQAGSPVDIVGDGSNKTAIRTSSTSAGVVILRVLEPTSTIADLRVHHNSAAPTAVGIQLAGDADDVMVTNQAVAGQFDGIELIGTQASLDDASVSLVYPRTTQNRAVFVGAGVDATILDSYLEGAVGVSNFGEVTILRSRIRADQGVVGSSGSTTTVRDSALRTPGPMESAYQILGFAAAGSGATVLTAERVTAVSKDGTGYGVWVVPNDGGGNSASVELEGSVLHNFDTAVRMTEGGGSNASFAATWSAYDLGSTFVGAGTTYTTGAGMLDLRRLDPGFRALDDTYLALRHDSPLIDAGDPAYQPRFFGLDVRSLFRPADGDGSGSPAVVDIGGYEYQYDPPVVVAEAVPASVPIGTAATFDASKTTDSDDEDLTFAWAFDDGTVVNGETAPHAFGTPGQHSATVTVTDEAGLRASAIVTVEVTGATTGPAPPPGPPAGNVAPVLSRLTIAPSRFRVAGRARAGASARRTAVRRAASGATIRYTLSEPARVTLTVQRAAAGRRVGRACARPSRANRGRRACTRWVAAGSFAVVGVQGANAHRFSGRIGRRALSPGRYRLTARARDAGGLSSAPVAPRAFTIVR